MPGKVRVGVIGTSGRANFMYLASLHPHPHANLIAICGRGELRAQEMADKYQISQVYTDYKK